MRQVLEALRAAWWLLLVGLLVGAGAALAVSLASTPIYESRTQLFVSTNQSTTTSEAFQGSQLSRQRVASYVELLHGEELAERIIEELRLPESSRELKGRIVASEVPNTVLIDVTVSDPSATRAMRIAAAIGEEFPELANELESTSPGTASPVKVTVTDEPETASAASSPQISVNVVTGGLAGILGAAALVLVRARLDRTVKDGQEVPLLARAPVIGTVLRDEVFSNQHLAVGSGRGRAAEDYRRLRTNLQFLNVDEPPKVIMVSSAMPSEGKTTVVVNLAVALAEAGRKVTIIEADLRQPKVTRYLGMVDAVGLTNVLAGSADLDEVVQAYGEGRLRVLAAGPRPPNPGELLSSSQMASLVAKLRGEGDYVLVDAPPLLPVADSSGLAVMMDGVLLSVRYGSTTKDQLRQAATTLERVGAKTLGVILNIVPPKADLASAYGYGYSYATEGKHGIK
jgi:receptor protein-tyrosine kinase